MYESLSHVSLSPNTSEQQVLEAEADEVSALVQRQGKAHA